jgi:hypothetical protein
MEVIAGPPDVYSNYFLRSIFKSLPNTVFLAMKKISKFM